MIELVCDKTRAFFRETEKLTSGSIGVTINFLFSPEWDGLLKTAVFIAGKESRDVVLTVDSCKIPPEVLVCPGENLRIGVFGETADKTLVIPTIYASAGTIRPGASPSGMSSAPPTPSWPEQVQAIAIEAKEAADSVRRDADAGKFNGPAGKPGGWYTPAVTQPDANTIRMSFTPSKEDMPDVEPKDITLPAGGGGGGSSIAIDETLTKSGQAADAKTVGDRLDSLSEEIATLQTSGLTTAQINALDGMFKVCAFTKDDVSAEYTAFKTAFGITDSGGETEVTLTSITATYDGGDVAVGTALSDLTGIVVTATYSDGSTATVTEYTLSGAIAEGSNTVTVTYQGKTATFTVTGVAESGGGDIVATWESGVPYVKNVVDNEYVEKNGTITTYNNWSRTDYLNCYGASKIVYSGVTYPGGYNAFYDEDKKFISNFEALAGTGDSEVVVPDNAVYVVFSSMTSSVHSMVITPYA